VQNADKPACKNPANMMMIVVYHDFLTTPGSAQKNSMLNQIVFLDRVVPPYSLVPIIHTNGWYHDVNFVKSLCLSLDKETVFPGS